MGNRILVVDDSQVERVLIEGLLRKNPEYRLQLAENGQEALEAIAARPPDLVVTDLVMPIMDGLELVRMVRKRHAEMGFADGWGKALDQLVAHMKRA